MKTEYSQSGIFDTLSLSPSLLIDRSALPSPPTVHHSIPVHSADLGRLSLPPNGLRTKQAGMTGREIGT